MFVDKQMTQKSETGKLGEDIACKYLKSNGYSIIERNFRKPWGELDIVAKYKDGTLVFVEVKTMKDIGELKPEDQLTSSKLKKLRRTASLYAGENQNLVSDKNGWRIDVIAINLPENYNILTNLEKNCEIRHWENVQPFS